MFIHYKIVDGKKKIISASNEDLRKDTLIGDDEFIEQRPGRCEDLPANPSESFLDDTDHQIKKDMDKDVIIKANEKRNRIHNLVQHEIFDMALERLIYKGDITEQDVKDMNKVYKEEGRHAHLDHIEDTIEFIKAKGKALDAAAKKDMTDKGKADKDVEVMITKRNKRIPDRIPLKERDIAKMKKKKKLQR